MRDRRFAEKLTVSVFIAVELVAAYFWAAR